MNAGPASAGPRWRDVEREPTEYFEQRRRLPDSAVFNEIVTKPHWRISIFPIEFKKARFRDLDQCRHFASSCCVRTPSGISYPQVWLHAVESGREYVACDTGASLGPIGRTERWVLFRSALFVQNRLFNESPQLAGRIHVLEVLDTTTAALEFATRMTQQVELAPEIAITIGLHSVEGRQLTWPQDIFLDRDVVGRNGWCQDETVQVSRQTEPGNIAAHGRELAFELAMEIYAQFGWADPPGDRLREVQKARFGGG
jgi:hypothetical protein